MRKNTLSRSEYVLSTIYWIVVIYMGYRTLSFRSVSGLTILTSHLILIGLTVALSVTNYLISGRFARNETSTFLTSVIPFGIYSYLSFGMYLDKITTFILCASGIVMAAYIAVAFTYGINKAFTREKIIKIRFRRIYLGMRNIVAITGIVFITYVALRINVVGGLINSSEVKGTAVYGDEYALAENIDMFLLLQPGEWEKLDVKKRLSVLQTVLNTEGRYLSFNKKITLYASKLNLGTLGYTDYDNNLIQIDIDQLGADSDSRKCVEIILHEAYHVSQMQYKEIYDSLSESDKNCIFMLEAATFADEFENYTSGTDNYYDYFSQSLEASARAYSVASTEVIFNRIDEYLSGEIAE